MIELDFECPICHCPHSVEVDYRDFISWQKGTLVQKAFPYLEAEEREQIISNICPECQKDIFKEA